MEGEGGREGEAVEGEGERQNWGEGGSKAKARLMVVASGLPQPHGL